MQINVSRGGQELGVFSSEEVRAGLASGKFQPADYGWTEGMTEWSPLSSFPGLAAAPPPPQPPPMSPAIPPVAAPPPAVALPPVAVSAPMVVSAPVTTASPVVGPATPGGQVPTSGAAVASLVCGILSLTMMPVLATLPAIICGHIARSNIKRAQGALKGDGMALGGLIMGYISIILSVLVAIGIAAILAGIALPVFANVQTKGMETKALSNAKMIATACRHYALDNKDEFPKTLEELIPDYLEDNHYFVCPFSPDDPMGYEYYGAGMKDSDPNAGTTVLIVSKTLSKGKNRVVVYADTSGRVANDMPELPPR